MLLLICELRTGCRTFWDVRAYGFSLPFLVIWRVMQEITAKHYKTNCLDCFHLFLHHLKSMFKVSWILMKLWRRFFFMFLCTASLGKFTSHNHTQTLRGECFAPIPPPQGCHKLILGYLWATPWSGNIFSRDMVTWGASNVQRDTREDVYTQEWSIRFSECSCEVWKSFKHCFVSWKLVRRISYFLMLTTIN